tara:strand:- start:67 stop:192 length:126 start_codon:yes stop_codon:yes gene_type:complete
MTNDESITIKKVRNISWFSYNNFSSILEEKNEDSDEYYEID